MTKALLVLDATSGVTEQDRVLAQKISDDGRACVLICNKWDAVANKDSTTFDKSVKYFRSELPQVRWAPILFTSAATGQRVGKVYGVVDEAIQAHRKRVRSKRCHGYILLHTGHEVSLFSLFVLLFFSLFILHLYIRICVNE